MSSTGGCNRFIRKVHAPTIEEDEFGKAKSFRLFSIQRPHMRAFHTSWFCFFIAFVSWFGIQPLVPTIRKELGLSKKDVANSGIASIAATILVRVVVGPLCDKFGPRRVMSALLIIGSVPLAFVGLVKNATGLIVVRLCVGILGGAFVPCQFWSSAMFNVKIIGTANALVGGWGNLGGGFTFILMPALFELMKIFGADEFLAWKVAILIPVVIVIVIGVIILWTSDDCPQGKWSLRKLPSHGHVYSADTSKYNPDGTDVGQKDKEAFENKGFDSNENGVAVKKEKTSPIDMQVSTTDSESGEQKDGLCNGCDVWMIITIGVLVIQYGLCFGIEIAVNTVMNLYFLYKFKVGGCAEGVQTSMVNGTLINTTMSSVVDDDPNACSVLSQNTASLIASLFGLMNLFARALGGIFSDVLRKFLQIPGRLLAHMICLVSEGILLIVFSQMTTIPSAIGVMICFSLCVQMSEGTTFALVPYIHPRKVGVVAGLIGAGGNAGALVWNTIWSQLVDDDPSRWFWLLGIIVLCGSVLTLVIPVQKRHIWHCFCRK